MKKTILLMAALGLVALQACKEEENTPAANVVVSGTCGAEGDGSNLTWSLADDGTLTIKGRGAMADFSYIGPSPATHLGYKGGGAMEVLSDIKQSYIEQSVPWEHFQEYISTVVIQDGVTSIGAQAFEFCSDLTSITIPSSVTSIGSGAFSDCTGLPSITIPKGVTSVGDRTFLQCTGLTSIILPESVTSIGHSAFSGCESLTSITLPKGVTSIGGSAFSSCTGLTSMTLPEGVTSIGGWAFFSCTGLKEITVKAATPPAVDDFWWTFYEVDQSIPVYVPAGSIDAYRGSEWGSSSATSSPSLINSFTFNNYNHDEYEKSNFMDGCPLLGGLAGVPRE